MWVLIQTAAVLFVILFLIYIVSIPEYRLRIALPVALAFLVITFPLTSNEWARMTSTLVTDDTDAHFALPDYFDDTQVVCIHFPDDEVPSDIDQGRTFFDYDGTEFMKDSDWNETGVCVGGFDESSAWKLFNDALNATSMSMNSTQFDFGVLIDSIHGVNPAAMQGDFDGAYWSLYVDDTLSLVGIQEVILSDDTVITWRVDYW